VHIRDMRTIIETWPSTRAHPGPDRPHGLVRIALGRAIVQQLFPGESELPVMALDPSSNAC
jgi:flagellar biosynthesis protein FlhA